MSFHYCLCLLHHYGIHSWNPHINPLTKAWDEDATYANARSTFEACRGVQKAFKVAFQSGSVMGFLPTAILSVKLVFKDDMLYMRPLLVMVLVDPQ